MTNKLEKILSKNKIDLNPFHLQKYQQIRCDLRITSLSHFVETEWHFESKK